MLILLLLSALPASAEHHRGHSKAFLDEALESLLIVDQELQRYLDAYEKGSSPYKTDEKMLGLHRNVSLSVNKTIETLLQAHNALDQPGTETLDVALRMLTQPNNSKPKSAVFHLWAASYVLNGLYGATPIPSRARSNLLGISAYLTKAWKSIDMAAWHINDAIREEVYLDPAFACNGPNNHCQ